MRCTIPVVLLVASLTALDAAPSQRGADSPHRRDLVGRQFDARVLRVADGDTLEATVQGESRTIRVRLEGIDAPELGEVFSREAQAFLRALVGNAPVRVSGRDLDNYGRLVARVAAGGQDASTALVRAGLACHAYRRDAALAREESQARAVGVGFWAANAKKPICVERTSFSARSSSSPQSSARNGRVTKPATPARESRGFRGNVSSKLYHASWCPNYNCRNCTRLFVSEAEAKMAGFRPAADCAE
jgi:micrococcal nuclease